MDNRMDFPETKIDSTIDYVEALVQDVPDTRDRILNLFYRLDGHRFDLDTILRDAADTRRGSRVDHYLRIIEAHLGENENGQLSGNTQIVLLTCLEQLGAQSSR